MTESKYYNDILKLYLFQHIQQLYLFYHSRVPNQDLVAIGVGVRPLADDNITWTLVPVKRSATVENVVGIQKMKKLLIF